jgi:hypothetical protein
MTVRFIVSFANGERLEGEGLENARRCIAIARRSQSPGRLPAQIWDAPKASVEPNRFLIRGGQRLVEEHLPDGEVIVPRPRPDRVAFPGVRALPHSVSLSSLGAEEPWQVEGRLEEWVNFAGREGYGWVGLARPIRIPLGLEGPPCEARRVLVGTRHPGWDLRLHSLPLHVYVCRPASGADHGSVFEPGDILTSVWAIASDATDWAG